MTHITSSGELIPKRDAEAIIEVATTAASPHKIENVYAPHIVVGPDGTYREVDLTQWRLSPVRKIGTYKPATVDSLIAYIKHYDEPEASTTIWVHPTLGKIVAVLDDDPGGEPGFGQHRAIVGLAHPPEWDYWLAQNGNLLGQETFAEHIEGGMWEIEEPPAADVLEIAQSFHATKDVSFRSQTLLASGEVQLKYDENVEAKAGRTGQLEVPRAIMLSLSPFIGEEPRTIAARLRFRLTGGNLKLGYVLDRPHILIRDALERVAERLGEEFPNVYLGEPD